MFAQPNITGIITLGPLSMPPSGIELIPYARLGNALADYGIHVYFHSAAIAAAHLNTNHNHAADTLIRTRMRQNTTDPFLQAFGCVDISIAVTHLFDPHADTLRRHCGLHPTIQARLLEHPGFPDVVFAIARAIHIRASVIVHHNATRAPLPPPLRHNNG
jgi:hypothetical protein